MNHLLTIEEVFILLAQFRSIVLPMILTVNANFFPI
jgi:hypothetical protein